MKQNNYKLHQKRITYGTVRHCDLHPILVLGLAGDGKVPMLILCFPLCRPTGVVVLDDPHRNGLSGVRNMQLVGLIGVMPLLDVHEPIVCGLPVDLIAGSNEQNFGDPPLEGFMIVRGKGRGFPWLNGKVTPDKDQKQVLAGHGFAMFAVPALQKSLEALLNIPPELVEKTAKMLLINGKPIILGLSCLNRIPLHGHEVENFYHNEGSLTSDLFIFDDFDAPPKAMLDGILDQHEHLFLREQTCSMEVDTLHDFGGSAHKMHPFSLMLAWERGVPQSQIMHTCSACRD